MWNLEFEILVSILFNPRFRIPAGVEESGVYPITCSLLAYFGDGDSGAFEVIDAGDLSEAVLGAFGIPASRCGPRV
jgi:hypothetical protein